MRTLSLILRAARVVHPIKGPREVYRRGRFIVAAVKHRGLINQWLRAGDAGGLRGSLESRPQMIGIVEWPYLHKEWGTPRRFEAVLGHYLEIDQLRWLRMGVEESRTIADLTDLLPGLRIILDRPVWFQREGELTLNLFVDDTRVYSLAFILGRESGRRMAYVGAVQGRNLDNIESVYKDITKKLHGSRPRDFLVAVFQMVCEAAGVERILAVDEQCRHHRHPYFGVKSTETTSASYDDIWSDRGGAPAAGGFFELPVAPSVRPESDIPTHKRSMYRKRYALYDRIRGDIGRFAAGNAATAGGPLSSGETRAVGVEPTTS